jgi:uncharacterized protein YbjQ (UPF0145 family)
MTQMGYAPIKLLISTSVYSLGAIGGIRAAFQSLVRGELGDLTTLIYEAREQVFDRLNREATALGAEEVVGIKIYIVKLDRDLCGEYSGAQAPRHDGSDRGAAGASHHPRQGHMGERRQRPRNSIFPRRRLRENSA